MLEQETAQSIWEWSLIAVVRRELEQLQYLDSDISDDTGDSDVYAVVSRIGALTDLADEDGFDFSTKGQGSSGPLGRRSNDDHAREIGANTQCRGQP
ncbi:hypothetical protein [Pseudomonas viridiflava]|uniref:hypothetical protein n=2 Tax=Pseudomonas viridiflava TaxID=33069 RepID=UPI0013D66831|nr:hypothetical protein [Pseudomonas viridiflava]